MKRTALDPNTYAAARSQVAVAAAMLDGASRALAELGTILGDEAVEPLQIAASDLGEQLVDVDDHLEMEGGAE